MDIQIGSKVEFMAEDRFSNRGIIKHVGWVFDIINDQIYVEGQNDGEIYNIKEVDITPVIANRMDNSKLDTDHHDMLIQIYSMQDGSNK